MTGKTARLISAHRPQVPTLALSPRIETVRRCAIYWGVRGELNDEPDDTAALLDVCTQAAKSLRLCEPGEKIGITAGLPVGKAGGTNLFKVQVVE
jgi:pyruvate kinase